MSHEIDVTAGQPAIFTTGTPPWHGLGSTVRQAPDSQSAIKLAHLDWRVEQYPVQAVDAQGRVITTDRLLANVRQDTRSILGIVTSRYVPFQNIDAFIFCDAVVGQGLARYESAGALRGGRRIWMLLKLPEVLAPVKDDEVQPYLLVCNTHDGSNCLRVLLTTIRVVCQNTLNLALSVHRSEGMRIAHRGNLQDRVEQARLTLGLVHRRLDHFGQQAKALCNISISPSQVDQYFQLLAGPDNPDMGDRQRSNRQKMMDRLVELFESPTNTLAGMRGTPWAAFNAASEYADHHRRLIGSTTHQKQENRLRSIWFGSNDGFKQKAWDQVLELAKLN